MQIYKHSQQNVINFEPIIWKNVTINRKLQIKRHPSDF